jgi:hypothetical protein
MSEKKKKPIFKRWWFWVLAIIIVFAAAGGGEEDTAEPANAKPAAEKPAETEKPKEAEAKKEETKKEEPKEVTVGKGQPLKVGDVTFTVTGTSTATNVGGEYGVKAQGQFLILDVIVKNEGKEAITTDSSFFKLKSGDITYDADGTAAVYANEDNNFFLQKVNPGLENKGKVVFDIPADATNLQVQVQTGFWGTETGVINLQ